MASQMSSGRASTTPPKPQQQTQHTQPSTAMPSVAHDRIARRAYEKWCQKGCHHGTDQQDWIEAESELRTETTPSKR